MGAFVLVGSLRRRTLRGSAYPQTSVQDLLEALSSYPNATIEHMRYLNRRPYCFPFQGFVAEPGRSSTYEFPGPRREGSLAERLLALRNAETEAAVLRNAAALVAQKPLARLEEGAARLIAQLVLWPETEVGAYPRVTAVPESMRARMPGVPGEAVHFEHGVLCVMENLPRQSHTLTAAAAIQVLRDETLRLHAVVDIEHWLTDGNQHEELWRSSEEVAVADAAESIHLLFDELTEVVRSARRVFDRARGAHGADGDAGHRAGALLLPGDHGRDGGLFHQASLLRCLGDGAC